MFNRIKFNLDKFKKVRGFNFKNNINTRKFNKPLISSGSLNEMSKNSSQNNINEKKINTSVCISTSNNDNDNDELSMENKGNKDKDKDKDQSEKRSILFGYSRKDKFDDEEKNLNSSINKSK